MRDIIAALVISVLGVIGLFHLGIYILKPDNQQPELIEWSDSAGYKSAIWINGKTYYGEGIDNIAGEKPRFIIYRGDDYLVLPDKIIVRKIKKEQ
jgi:hypothetical protein